MRVITRQMLANRTADLWAKQYPSSRGDKLDILERLKGLGPSPMPDDVDEVIGNGSWTRTKCDECGVENIDVVEIGEELDYESSTANVCRACLVKASNL